MERRFREFKAKLAEIHDLNKAGMILGWDQQTMMPPGGAAVRAEQLATLGRIAHELFVGDDVGRMLDELAEWESSLPYDSDEASLIRVTRRDWEKARRVSPELRADMTRHGALAYTAWVDARAASDYEVFIPYLRKTLELKHRYIECFEGLDDYDEPYDVLLDDYEHRMKTADVRVVFDRLKEELLPFIADVGGSGAPQPPALDGPFPVDAQQRFERVILDRFGFDAEMWRIDPTVHPFATNSATTDIRITTRYSDHNLSSLFSAMHEFGHGLYEHGVSPTLERTPLARGASLGLHESQSRMWENLVGRSRGFWRFFYPELQRAFPERLGSVDEDDFYRAVNRLESSLIRVDADEATYNFHIILRFELEQELLSGEVSPRALPEAWRARMREYLALDVPDDARGVLQDVHWARGSFGYFPTYSLGNVMSVQIWEQLRDEIADLDEQIEAGEFAALRAWLREHLHRHGRKFTPKETLERVVGGPIDPGPYIAYLRAKLGAIYGLAPTASAD